VKKHTKTEHEEELEKLDNEIEYLESKLGIKGSKKKKAKEHRLIDM
jgi:hypothetical protein